jgi:hypothetical protein
MAVTLPYIIIKIVVIIIIIVIIIVQVRKPIFMLKERVIQRSGVETVKITACICIVVVRNKIFTPIE